MRRVRVASPNHSNLTATPAPPAGRGVLVRQMLLPVQLASADGVTLDASYNNATAAPDSAGTFRPPPLPPPCTCPLGDFRRLLVAVRRRSSESLSRRESEIRRELKTRTFIAVASSGALAYFDALGVALLAVAAATPNGVLVFFKARPSVNPFFHIVCFRSVSSSPSSSAHVVFRPTYRMCFTAPRFSTFFCFHSVLHSCVRFIRYPCPIAVAPSRVCGGQSPSLKTNCA